MSSNPFDDEDLEQAEAKKLAEAKEVEENKNNNEEEQEAAIKAQPAVVPPSPPLGIWARIKAAASNSIIGKTLASIGKDLGNAGGPYWLIKAPFRIVTSAVKLAVGVVGQVAKTLVYGPLKFLGKNLWGTVKGLYKGTKAFLNATFVEGAKQAWNGKGFKEKAKGVGRIFAGVFVVGSVVAASVFTAGIAPAFLGGAVVAASHVAAHTVGALATAGYSAGSFIAGAGISAASTGLSAASAGVSAGLSAVSAAVASATALVSTGVAASSGAAASVSIAGIGVSGTVATGVGIGMVATGAVAGAAVVVGVSRGSYKAYDTIKKAVTKEGVSPQQEQPIDKPNQKDPMVNNLAKRLSTASADSKRNSAQLEASSNLPNLGVPVVRKNTSKDRGILSPKTPAVAVENSVTGQKLDDDRGRKNKI